MDTTSVCWLSVNGTILGCIGFSIIEFTKQYLQQDKNNNGNNIGFSGIVYWPSLLFIICTLFCSICLIFIGIYSINNDLLISILSILCNIQHCLSSLVMCIRNNSVFVSTQFAISKFVLICYGLLFSFIPIAFILSIHILSLTQIWTIIIPITYFIIIIFDISLVITFLYKLVTAFKHCDADKKTLIHIISKITVLSVFSSIFTLICIIGLVSIQSINIISIYLILFETFMNWLCLILSYKCFNKYYKIFCGCFGLFSKIIVNHWIIKTKNVQNSTKFQVSRCETSRYRTGTCDTINISMSKTLHRNSNNMSPTIGNNSDIVSFPDFTRNISDTNTATQITLTQTIEESETMTMSNIINKEKQQQHLPQPTPQKSFKRLESELSVVKEIGERESQFID